MNRKPPDPRFEYIGLGHKDLTLTRYHLCSSAGAFAHYSYALHDAIDACDSPVVEVHISNVYVLRSGAPETQPDNTQHEPAAGALLLLTRASHAPCSSAATRARSSATSRSPRARRPATSPAAAPSATR